MVKMAQNTKQMHKLELPSVFIHGTMSSFYGQVLPSGFVCGTNQIFNTKVLFTVTSVPILENHYDGCKMN